MSTGSHSTERKSRIRRAVIPTIAGVLALAVALGIWSTAAPRSGGGSPDSLAVANNDTATDTGTSPVPVKTPTPSTAGQSTTGGGGSDSARVDSQKPRPNETEAEREERLYEEQRQREKAAGLLLAGKKRGMSDSANGGNSSGTKAGGPGNSPRTSSLREQFQKLSPADLAVHGLDSLRTGIQSTVVVRIAIAATKDDSAALVKQPGLVSGVYHAVANIGDSARVCLRSATEGDFSVTSGYGECSTQPLAAGSPAEWSWLVTPLKSGHRTLMVSVEALLVSAPSKKFQQFYPVEVGVGDGGVGGSSSIWKRLLVGALVLILIVGVGLALRASREHSRRIPAPAPALSTAPGAGHVDAFISHSTKDATTAAAICAALEQRGLRCWIAPRDIPPGSSFDESIIAGIESSRSVVLVLSDFSNASPEVAKEVRNAVQARIPVLPIRIQPVTLSPALRYHLSAAQWIDAANPPHPEEVDTLAAAVARVSTAQPA